jgi:MFS family permease
VLAGLGIGGLLGAAMTTRLVGRWGEISTLVAALTTVGLAFVVMFAATSVTIGLAGAALAGAGGTAMSIVTGTVVQARTPDGSRGRVAAAVSAGNQAGQVLGTTLGALLVPLVGLRASLEGWSVGVLAVAASTRRLLPPACRQKTRTTKTLVPCRDSTARPGCPLRRI